MMSSAVQVYGLEAWGHAWRRRWFRGCSFRKLRYDVFVLGYTDCGSSIMSHHVSSEHGVRELAVLRI